MEIIITQGTESELANRVTQRVIFEGRKGKDADMTFLADYVLKSTYESQYTDMLASITLNAGQIALMVRKSEFDPIVGRLIIAETNILQNSDSIQLRATKSELDTVNGRLVKAEAKLQVTADAITTLVTRSEYNEQGVLIGQLSTSINQTKDALLLKANSSVVDALTGRLATAEASILINANAIISKVSRSEFDDQGDLIGLIETRVTQTETAITQLATKSTIDAITGRLTTAEGKIQVQAEAILLMVKTTDFNTLGQKVAENTASIKLNSDQILLKVNKTLFDPVVGRLETAESTISQLNNQISLMVTKTVVSNLDARVTTNTGNIKILSDNILLKVNQSVVDTLTQRVSTAEATISVLPGQIQSKVSSTDFNGNTLVSLINQQPGSVKISAKNIVLDGLTTARSVETSQTFPKLTMNKDNDNAFKAWYANGQLGIEVVAGADGVPTLRGYDSAGNKRWDLAANATQIVFIAMVPDSVVDTELNKVLDVNAAAVGEIGLTSTERATITTNLHTLFQYQTLADEPGLSHAPTLVFIDQSNYLHGYLFQAGVPDTNAQYNGYHTGGDKESSWIANGWYVVNGPVGTKYHPADYDDTNGPQVVYVEVFCTVGGKRRGSQVIQVPV